MDPTEFMVDVGGVERRGGGCSDVRWIEVGGKDGYSGKEDWS